MSVLRTEADPPEPTGVRRPRSDRVAETVAAELRERILGGAVRDGLLPTQDALMASFGVGAPSVREALRILEVEGLITVRRGKNGGATVHRPDGASVAHALGLTLHGERTRLAELAEALLLLEPGCAAACAARADRHEALVPALEDNLKRTTDALDDGPEVTRCGREFHDLVVDGTPNSAVRLLVRSLLAVWTTQEEAPVEGSGTARQVDPAARRGLVEEHRALTRRIAAGDAAGAQDLARRHIAGQQAVLLAHLGDRLVDATSPDVTAGFRRLSFPAGRSRDGTG